MLSNLHRLAAALLCVLPLCAGYAAENDEPLFVDPALTPLKPKPAPTDVTARPEPPAAAKPAPKSNGKKPPKLKPAETIEIPDPAPAADKPAPAAKKVTTRPPVAPVLSDEAPAEIVPLPPLKKSEPAKKTTNAAAPGSASKSVEPIPAALRKADGGYKYLLSGVLDTDLTLGAEHSPLAIVGALVVPANLTLTIKPGVVIHLLADPRAEKPAEAGAPDPTQSATLWIWGTLLAEGITGNPIEVLNQEKYAAALLLYGNNTSRIEGTRFKDVAIAQNGGVAYWTNCEVLGARHFAVASGAALLTHCSLRECGGLFATYNAGPWSLLVRRCLFDRCKEGIVLGSDPGDTRLIVEKNHFIGTRGAHIRAMPVALEKDAKGKAVDLELLIGENWYGTAIVEEADLRLVDRRSDPALRARLNTRPPADQPYPGTGAGVPATILSNSVKEQLPLQQKLILAHPQAKASGALKAAAKPVAASTAAKTDKPAPAAEKPALVPLNKAVKKQ